MSEGEDNRNGQGAGGDRPIINASGDWGMNDLIPNYLKRRHAELVQIDAALIDGDLAPAAMIGHKLVGNAQTFGFAPLGELGRELEAAAVAQNAIEVRRIRMQIGEFLNKIDTSGKYR